MNALRLALLSLLRQPGRSALGVLGVAAVGALLFDMLLLSRGLVLSFRAMLDAYGFDVRVSATESLFGPQLRDAARTVAGLRALPEVEAVLPLRLGRAQLATGGERAFDVSLIGSEPDGARRQWKLLSGGELQAGADGAEAALVNPALAALLRLRPGSPLRLRGPCAGDAAASPPAAFRVAGVARFPFEEPREHVVALNLQGFERACPEQPPDRAQLLLVASRREAGGPDAAVAAIRRARPELAASTNEQLVARFQQVEFSYFRQISAVLATLTLFFGALLITVLLTVSVNQRLGEVAALRALGFSQRRVVADVLLRSLLLVGAGALLALPLGLLLSSWLDAILKQMPGVPENLHFFAFEPRALYLYASLLLLAALGAALYPMWLVARLPIAATLRDEIGS